MPTGRTWLMVIFFSISLAGWLEPHMGAAGEESEHSIPASKDRRILAVCDRREAGFMLGTVELHAGENVMRIMTCDAAGNIKVLNTIAVDRTCYAFRGFAAGEDMTLGWAESKGALWLAEHSAGGFQTRLVLPAPESGSGSISDWWLLRSKEHTFLVVDRAEQATNPTDVAFHVLYCYRLQNGENPELIGKVRVDVDIQDRRLVSDIEECGGGETGLFIWQTIRLLGPPPSAQGDGVDLAQRGVVTDFPQTVRVSKWDGIGPLEWRSLYTGIYKLSLFLDHADGSRAVVKEWKSPEHGAGIFCALDAGADASIPLPIATDGPRMSGGYLLLKRRGARPGWILAMRERASNTIVVREFDTEFHALGKCTKSGKGNLDYRLVAKDGGVWLVCLRADAVHIVRLDFVSAEEEQP